MNVFRKFINWLKKDQQKIPRGYDVNAQNDFARRAMYPNMTDEQYNAIFHAKDKEHKER